MGEMFAILLFIVLLVWLFAIAATPAQVGTPAPPAAAATLPASVAAPATLPATIPAATAPQAASGAHTVQSGETLTRIALRYGVTVDAIVAANPSITDRNQIYPGQTVTIPAAAVR